MRVLIANPPAYFRRFPDRHFIQAGSRWSHSFWCPRSKRVKHYQPYPFFIGYASSLLKRDTEARVKALDACALDFDEKTFIDYVKRYKPDLLLVEAPSISFPLMEEVLEEIKREVDCKIGVAGLHATAFPRQILEKRDFIDYVFIGEYERTLRDLIASGEDKVDHIKGLGFRSRGILKVNLQRNLADLNELPWPDRSDLPVTLYHDFEIAGEPTVQMIATRGCPYRCKFCYITILYERPSYRQRAVNDVVDEMEYSKEKLRARQVYFDDDTLAINKKYLRKLALEIIHRRLEIPWAFMGDVTIDRETLKLLSRAGCVGIKFGVETFTQDVSKHVSKSFINVELVRKFMSCCKELGIWTHATYQVGLPGDTVKGMLTTLRFALQLDTDSIQVSIATPLPGTPFYEEARERGWLITEDYTLYDGACRSVLNYPWLSKEDIEKIHKLFLDSWRNHLLKRYLREPKRILREHKRILRKLEVLFMRC
jgi:radical SAM superfamily enzyme YgiQ (UPF0313 family)